MQEWASGACSTWCSGRRAASTLRESQRSGKAGWQQVGRTTSAHPAPHILTTPPAHTPASTMDWYCVGSSSRISAFSFSLFSSSSMLSSRIWGCCGRQAGGGGGRQQVRLTGTAASGRGWHTNSGWASRQRKGTASARHQKLPAQPPAHPPANPHTHLVFLGLHLEAGVAKGLLEGDAIDQERVAQPAALQEQQQQEQEQEQEQQQRNTAVAASKQSHAGRCTQQQHPRSWNPLPTGLPPRAPRMQRQLPTCTFLMPSMRRSRVSGSSLVTASTTILAKKSRSPLTCRRTARTQHRVNGRMGVCVEGVFVWVWVRGVPRPPTIPNTRTAHTSALAHAPTRTLSAHSAPACC